MATQAQPDPATQTDPVSQKVVASTIGAVVTPLLVFVCTNYIPYFHHVLPTGLDPILQVLGAGVGALIAGYFVRHKATLNQILTAFSEVDQIQALRTLQPNSLVSIENTIKPQIETLIQELQAAQKAA